MVVVMVYRHKLTHVELVSPQDRPRFQQLHAIADAQVSGDFTLPTSKAHKDIERLVGHNKSKDSIPVRALHEAGAVVTLSSDWDVSTINPFIGLSHAVNRGNQSVDMKVKCSRAGALTITIIFIRTLIRPPWK